MTERVETKRDLEHLLKSNDAFIFDCDGVLWRGHTPLPGAVEFLHRLEKMGKKVFYLTNNSLITRQDMYKAVTGMGYPGQVENMLSTTFLMAKYLKRQNFQGKAFILGHKAISEELKEEGIESEVQHIDALDENWSYSILAEKMRAVDPSLNAVVMGADPFLSYLKIAKANRVLGRPGSLFVVADVDAIGPLAKDVFVPAGGPGIAAVEKASGRKAFIVGKPHTFAWDVLQELHPNLVAAKTVMVGDRADSDIEFGHKCGLNTLMVGSGVHTWQDIEKWTIEGRNELVAKYYADDLGALNQLLS